MAAYPSFDDRFLIPPNKRLKFISLYIILTIAGIVIASLSEPRFLLITRFIRGVFSSSSSPEAAMAFGLISYKWDSF